MILTIDVGILITIMLLTTTIQTALISLVISLCF